MINIYSLFFVIIKEIRLLEILPVVGEELGRTVGAEEGFTEGEKVGAKQITTIKVILKHLEICRPVEG